MLFGLLWRDGVVLLAAAQAPSKLAKSKKRWFEMNVDEIRYRTMPADGHPCLALRAGSQGQGCW